MRPFASALARPTSWATWYSGRACAELLGGERLAGQRLLVNSLGLGGGRGGQLLGHVAQLGPEEAALHQGLE